jgi:dienelactone hydrolase
MTGITCPDCLSGSVQEGTPAGTVTTIHSLPTYVAQPERTPKAVIVFLPDIFGWEAVHSRLLADVYAKKGGFLVYLPNFMNGGSMSHSVTGLRERNSNLLAGFIPTASGMYAMENLLAPSTSIFATIFKKPFWLLRAIFAVVPFLIFNRQSTITPTIFNFHRAVRNDPETKDLKIGSAGFCWGGGYTTLLCQVNDLVDAGFTAHPSKMKFPDDWDKVQQPLSIAIGDVDFGIKVDMVKDIKELLEEMKQKGQNEVVIMPGAKHGFAVRANPKDETQVKSAREATIQALSWFARWLV